MAGLMVDGAGVVLPALSLVVALLDALLDALDDELALVADVFVLYPTAE